MDTIYRKEKINEILPLIALNHSEFVHNDEAESAKALAIFRDYNARKHEGNRYKQKKYKEKHYSHHKRH